MSTRAPHLVHEIHKKAAMAVAKLHRGRVRCEKCKREQAIDGSACFANGWPKCCGYTMTLLTDRNP